ncbi:MAG: LysR substrate-binding domain-containing protein [Pseudomonadota bacterium]
MSDPVETDLQLHFSTEFVDLRGGGFHLALRGGGTLEEGLVARTLVRMPLIAVAAPAYLRAHGTPKAARDLRHHRCLLGFARGVLPERRSRPWRPHRRGARTSCVPLHGFPATAPLHERTTAEAPERHVRIFDRPS